MSTSVYEQRRECGCKNAILLIPPLRSGSPNGYFLSSPLHSRLIPCGLTFDLPFAEVACSDALPRPAYPNTLRHSSPRHVRFLSPSSNLPIQEKPIPEGGFRGKRATGRAHRIIHRGDETDDAAVLHDLHFGPRLDTEFLPEPGGDDDPPFRQRPDGSYGFPTSRIIRITFYK